MPDLKNITDTPRPDYYLNNLAYYDVVFANYYKYNDCRVIEKIYSLSTLKEGWAYGEGVPASKEAIKNAIQLFKIGVALGFEVDARPEINGDVILNLFLKDNFVYITCKEGELFDLRYEKGIGQDYDIIDEKEDISLGAIINHLNHLREKWFLLELYHLPNTTPTARDSQVIVLTHSKVEYQYFPKNALSQSPEETANTRGNTIKPW